MQPTPTTSQPRCLVCGSSDITAPTQCSPDEGSTTARAKEQSGKPFSVVVHRASVCLSCGHVALSLDAKQLDKLRRAIGTLVPAV